MFRLACSTQRLSTGSETTTCGQGGLCGVLLGPGAEVVGAFAVAEVAEGFVGFARRLEIEKQGDERGYDLFERDEVLVDEVHPVAEQPAADEERVAVGGFANQADVAVVGPGAAVGATGHAERELLARQAELGQLGLELIDDAGQDALAFGDRQPARRPGDAGHRPAADLADLVRHFDVMAAEDFFELGSASAARSQNMMLWCPVSRMPGCSVWQISRSAVLS